MAAPDVVDVLWVIDDSISMEQQQTRLAAKPATWFYGLDGVDLHLGATTTSAWMNADDAAIVWGDAGCPDDGACYNAWAAALAPGTDGSDLEQGYGSAMTAFADSRNDGFLRDGALHVVAVASNDDDCTGDLGDTAVSEDCYTRQDELTPVDDVITGLLDLDRTGRVQIDALVGTTDSCADAVYANRYVDGVDATGGVAVDICTAAVADMLDTVSARILALPDRFVLPEAADPASFTVTVGGDEVSNDASGGWTYDEALWMVVFHGMSAPNVGDEVVVRYNPA